MIITSVAWYFVVWNTLVQYSIVMDLSEPEQPFHKRNTLFTMGALSLGEVKGLAQVTQPPSDRGCI